MHAHTRTHKHPGSTSNKEMQTKAHVVMHTRELSCDHDWGNSEASEGSCPGLNLRCNDQIEYMHVVYRTKTKTCSKINAHSQQMCTWPCMFARAHACVRICVYEMCTHLFVWVAVHLWLWMHSALYGQCRSINNATLAEVKEACVSGWNVEGEEEGEMMMGKWRGQLLRMKG